MKSCRMRRLRRFSTNPSQLRGGLSRQANLFLAGVCAEHLVDGLRAAGLPVIRPAQWRIQP
jgi:hypothetical protein